MRESGGVVVVLSGLVVVASGLYLIGLASVAVVNPSLARRFLGTFASSARAHYAEQAMRMVVGAGMVRFAPMMWLPGIFTLFGWILVITTAGLFMIPWRWHQKFGRWAIPMALKYLTVFGFGSAALGGLILFGASRALVR